MAMASARVSTSRKAEAADRGRADRHEPVGLPVREPAGDGVPGGRGGEDDRGKGREVVLGDPPKVERGHDVERPPETEVAGDEPLERSPRSAAIAAVDRGAERPDREVRTATFVAGERSERREPDVPHVAEGRRADALLSWLAALQDDQVTVRRAQNRPS